MNLEADIDAKAEALRKALRTQLGIKGRSFAVAVRRAGRLLPKRQRVQAQVITKAQELGGHPKLMRMVSQTDVQAAYKDISTYLAGLDPVDRKRGWWLRWAGDNVVNLLIVIVCFITWLVLAGHV